MSIYYSTSVKRMRKVQLILTMFWSQFQNKLSVPSILRKG